MSFATILIILDKLQNGLFLVVKKSSCFVLKKNFSWSSAVHIMYLIGGATHMTWIYESPKYPNSMITRPGIFF